jgi:hypothetical protein
MVARLQLEADQGLRTPEIEGIGALLGHILNLLLHYNEISLATEVTETTEIGIRAYKLCALCVLCG